jgi:hypothetical protein
MAKLLNDVQAGDLITSAMWKDVVEAINDLDDRVTELQIALGKVIITDLIYTPPLYPGNLLEIRGYNFGYSRGMQIVKFDQVGITEFRSGCSDTRLLVKVPAFTGLPEEGRDVTLLVGNGEDSTTRLLHIAWYEAPISGNLVDVIWESITPNPFGSGDIPRIGYRLRSRVGQARTFTISPTVSRTELQTGIEMRELQGTVEVPVSNGQIQLGSLQEKLFFVYLPTIPTSMTNGTSIRLTVSAVSGGVTGSDSRDLIVGEKSLVSDPNLTLSPPTFSAVDDAGVEVPGDGSFDSATNTILLRAGRFGRATLSATFEQTAGAPSVLGTYTVRLIPDGTLDGWTRRLETDPTILIEQNDLDTHSGGVPRSIIFSLETSASPSASQIEVRIERAGSEAGERMPLRLARLS